MENKVKVIKNFLEEYERIKPKSKEEFNKKRNKRKCKSSEYLIDLFKCSNWFWLIVICELSFYIEKKKESDLINEVEMIEYLFSNSDLRSILLKNKFKKEIKWKLYLLTTYEIQKKLKKFAKTIKRPDKNYFIWSLYFV